MASPRGGLGASTGTDRGVTVVNGEIDWVFLASVVITVEGGGGTVAVVVGASVSSTVVSNSSSVSSVMFSTD